MDEIDAALDFKNVSIVGRYIKDRTKNAQFIVISLRSEMFELADTLIGIYKTENATKCVMQNMKAVGAARPLIAERDKAKAAERPLGMGRPSLSQVPERRSGARMPLTCPPVMETNANDDEGDGEEERALSPLAQTQPEERRQSIGGETPVTSRRNLRSSQS